MLHALEKYNRRVQDSENIIPEDEPVFLLRAQDRVAPNAVLYWAEMAEKEGVDPEMIRLARKHAEKMVQWPKKKIADI